MLSVIGHVFKRGKTITARAHKDRGEADFPVSSEVDICESVSCVDIIMTKTTHSWNLIQFKLLTQKG